MLAQHIGEPGLNPQSCREEGKRDRGTRPEVSPSPPPTQAKARFSCSEDHQDGSEGKGGEFQALLPPEFILGVPRDTPEEMHSLVGFIVSSPGTTFHLNQNPGSQAAL